MNDYVTFYFLFVCFRMFVVQQIPESNLLMLVVQADCDCSRQHAPITMEPKEVKYILWYFGIHWVWWFILRNHHSLPYITYVREGVCIIRVLDVKVVLIYHHVNLLLHYLRRSQRELITTKTLLCWVVPYHLYFYLFFPNEFPLYCSSWTDCIMYTFYLHWTGKNSRPHCVSSLVYLGNKYFLVQNFISSLGIKDKLLLILVIGSYTCNT